MPLLDRALTQGELSWSAVRELCRVVTAETEAEWLSEARGHTLREIEKQVSGKKRGELPGAPADPQRERHVLRFEVTAETLATFREAMKKLTRDSGSALDDDTALLLMARHVLGGPKDDGRASYQIAVEVCERCGQAEQLARGEKVALGAELAQMVGCDAQRIEPTHVGRDAEPRNEAPNSRASTKRPKRATQTIPPATRRAVLARDGKRCKVPGCTNAVFLDIHHINLRSEDGSHDPDRLICVCAAHHRALHRGELTVLGSVSRGLEFRHADGRPYGAAGAADARAQDTFGKVFRTLRNLGFREREAKQALELLRAEMAHLGQAPSLEQALRRALALMAPPSRSN